MVTFWNENFQFADKDDQNAYILYACILIYTFLISKYIRRKSAQYIYKFKTAESSVQLKWDVANRKLKLHLVNKF
jgi:hypothetical protein